MISVRLIVVLALFLPAYPATSETPAVGGMSSDIAAYVGYEGDDAFQTVLPLSDGTVLIGGGLGSLDWIPEATRKIELTGYELAEKGNRYAAILHVSGDLKEILHVAYLPYGNADSFRVLRTTSAPGQPTGDLYASLSTGGEDYVLVRFDGNFVTTPVTGLKWATRIKANRKLEKLQPWDVGSDGKIVYATGGPHGPDWMALQRLNADGKDDTVPHWRRHWYAKPGGEISEHAGELASVPGEALRSGMVLKQGRGDFQSHTREAFLEKSSDGNGGEKQGRWPLDAMMSGPFNRNGKTDNVTGTGLGYYGYRWGSPTGGIGAIVIDRRTNQMIIGGNNKSRLPDGNPDFEPWVIAMDADGRMQWWQRLYPESKGVSTPDQYVDALAVDYTADATPGSLFVVARAHGNNVNNFWQGDQIKKASKPGWQVGFTGTNGNIHYNWLGKMTLDDGTMLAATYLAEYSEGAKHGKQPFANSKLDHWPHFRAGWPDLNTTRIEPHGLTINSNGQPVVVAVGRRVITTRHAFMQMPSPLTDKGAIGQWADFVRVYNSDLSDVVYSTILSGKWDLKTGKGGSPVDLVAAAPLNDGQLIIVGVAKGDKATGEPSGDSMPTRNVPDWASQNREASDSALLMKVSY